MSTDSTLTTTLSRPGSKVIKTFDKETEGPIVGMLNFNGKIFIATDRGIWILLENGNIERQKLEIVE